MKTGIQFRSVRARMLFWLLAIALVPLVIVGMIIYMQRASSIKHEAFDKLTAIRDLKVEQLNAWLDEKVGNVKTISQDFEIRGLEQRIHEKQKIQDGTEAISIARKLLDRYLENYGDYHELFVINPISGIVEISTDQSHEGKDESKDLFFTQPLQTREVFVKDIYFSKTLNAPSMSFSIPIFCLSHSGEHIAGILVARVDLKHSLYALLLNRSGMGQTGETLIVNKDVLALNELRWYENAPLKLKIRAKPAFRASQGESGITETADYRDEQVLAAFTNIAGIKWGFVAKQDLKEVYAPIRVLFGNILILLVISAVAVFWLAIFLAGNLSRPVLEMAEVSKKIQGGDISARNSIQSTDELGYLADSFNNMADSISSQIVTIKKAGDDLRKERDTLEGRVQERTLALQQELEERKRAEEALRESEERFRLLVEGVTDYAIFMLDSEGHILSWNTEAERIKGYQQNEIIGQHFSCFYPAEDIEDGKPQRGLRIATTEGRFEEEGWRLRKDGSQFWASVLITALRDEAGQLRGFSKVTRDISERKQAEEALGESEEDARSMSMELALSLSEVFEALKEISSGNPEVRIPETSGIELVTKLKHMVNLTAEELAEIVDLSHEFAMGLAEHFDVLHRVSKGDLDARISGTSQVELLESLKEVTNQMVEDVSAEVAKHERMEEALSKSRDYLDGIINGIYEGLLVIDRNFIIKDLNEPFLKEHGSVREDIIGRPCYEITHKANEPCSGSDHRCPVREVLDTGKPVRVEHIHEDRSGRRLIVELYAVPLLGADGNVEHVVELSQNITERKKAEKEKKKLEANLQRAEKMEVVGTLAGGVAHDLNNILGGLVSYPDLLLMDLPKDSPLRKPILTIQESGQKAAAIVQDLLTLARRGVAVSEVANPNDIVTEYLASPEHERLKSFHPRVQVETRLETDLLNILTSPVHLSKTIMNLVSNAAEALPDGGKVTISTKNQYIDKPVRGYDEVKEGDYVVLTVADNGTGILARDQQRIFEPFYTKKVMGRSGTGLGMAVVWGTVKDHKGYIELKSTEGKGTTFDLYFPVTRKELGKEKAPTSIEEFLGNGETILIVDDVHEQREIASMLLTKLGYSVHTVSSGEEAVEYVKTNSADLLVLDMIMDPGIDGLDTYKKIRELYPEQRAIIASGFSETRRVKQAQKLGAGQYIKKPYTLEKVGVAVKAELDA